MAKTLTAVGLEKQARRFGESIAHAQYWLNGVPATRDIFRVTYSGDQTNIYVYFDDTIVGQIADVQLIDSDGDMVAATPSDRIFEKPSTKGLYVAFKYKFTELEVESLESV